MDLDGDRVVVRLTVLVLAEPDDQGFAEGLSWGVGTGSPWTDPDTWHSKLARGIGYL